MISPSTTTYISFTKREYKFLPEPYKAYGSDSCSDQYLSEQESPYKLSSHSACVAQCRLQALIHNCSCTLYARDPDIPGVPHCSLAQLEVCYLPTLRDFRNRISECACPLPCTKVEYEAQMSTASLHNTARHCDSKSPFLDLLLSMEGMGPWKIPMISQTESQYLELK
ncbi:hypothetical protein EGW08_016242, partial [Elysia chlorotica]